MLPRCLAADFFRLLGRRAHRTFKNVGRHGS
jgi:hypothetical protein